MIRNFFREIKYFIQRGRRGFSDQDCWSFDDYLCGIIIGGLRRLKDKNNGCPSEFFDAYRKNNECKRWDDTLETMAQGFEAHRLLKEGAYQLRLRKKKTEYAIELDFMTGEQRKKKADEGMALFMKFFGALWD